MTEPEQPVEIRLRYDANGALVVSTPSEPPLTEWEKQKRFQRAQKKRLVTLQHAYGKPIRYAR